MRPRQLTILAGAALCAVLALAGCGAPVSASSPSSPSGLRPSPVVAGVGPNARVTVTGAFGTQPHVTIPAADPGDVPVYSMPVRGRGPVITASEEVLYQSTIYSWNGSSSRLAHTTYGRVPQIANSRLLPAPGLENAIVGKRIGSRIVAVLPPKQAGDPTGYTIAMVMVIDLLRTYPARASATGRLVSAGGGALPAVPGVPAGTQPEVRLPPASVKPPAVPRSLVLVKGSGSKIKANEAVIAQVTEVDWRTRKTLFSTWQHEGPLVITAAPTLTAGVDLTGQTAGSRVLLVIPPAARHASGGTAASEARTAPTSNDTLVLVVDIIGVVGSTPS